MMIARENPRRIWHRFIFAIVMLLIGHDAIMALNAHDLPSENAQQHHEVIAQECGTMAGTLSQSSTPLTPQPSVSFIVTLHVRLPISDSLNITGDDEPAADASTRRALTQVFLN